MGVDGAPLGVVVAPLLLVGGFVYLLCPLLPLGRPWARLALFAAVWVTVLRYLGWRFFDTVLPATGSTAQLGWIYFCFAVELAAFGDALILYLGFLRTTDRRREADAHEKRLRGAPAGSLPTVDVFIPTYSEPFDVLEKTIVGALSLDYPNFSVWVLDDGRRPWLKAFCEAKGVGYITRPDNAHAKAGNINHALKHTGADFVAIFDADFIPQRNFLMRTIGFFADPTIGIVQIPHAFYNHDPMQANLSVRKTLPDDQRFFFESIMPSRDGWNAAFCCGSNSVTRRAAMREIGDAIPTASITEDMLLSLSMLRRGFVTRYVCERLAFGLAPESVAAFFVQRQRWARGAIQILFLPQGPLGRGLRLMHRLLFLPTHWLSQSVMMLMSIVTPLVFMWTGLAPLVNVTYEAAVFYLLPMVLAVVGGIVAYAPRHYFPLAAQVLGTFQSFKILPTVLQTIIRPHGHVFKVTPKGRAAAGAGYERGVFCAAGLLMAGTCAGLIVNAMPEWRIVEQPALLPLVAFWGGINVTVLFLVCMICVQAPVRRGEERFTIDEPVWTQDARGALLMARIQDISLSGAGILVKGLAETLPPLGSRLDMIIRGVGRVAGTVARVSDDFLGVRFLLPQSLERDLLIRKIFTSGLDTQTIHASAWSVSVALLKSILVSSNRKAAAAEPAAAASPPAARLPAASFILAPVRWRPNLNLEAERRAAVA